jgi:uncharacterized SAM-binding protein YcdF (DUF218 family)
MLPGELKPVLTALALPPAAPLLLALLGILVAWRRRGLGLALVLAGVAATWLLSTNGMALVLARVLLPPVEAVRPAQLQQAQAIVVLGGGVLPEAPEYGAPQLGTYTASRLKYGIWLARQTGKPLAFAGGVGWPALGTPTEPEAKVAQRVAAEDYGVTLRWVDGQSRDTAENAGEMARLLHADGVRRIALVTDAPHMARALLAFRRAGFEVLPAPANFVIPMDRAVLRWLPSGHGYADCRRVVRDWLGLLVARAA